MRVIRCEQGSEEWRMARCGVATASQFNRLVTPAKLQPSKSLNGYALELLAEWLLGRPLDDGSSSPWMERGRDMEEEALGWYALDTGTEPDRVGFCATDDGLAGASPDALVGEDGGLEIKCPTAPVHLGYLLSDGAPRDYLHQIQGGLWVTGRQWWDFLSYCPGLPPAVHRVYPDARWQDALDEAMERLRSALEEGRAALRAKGCKTADEREAEAREAGYARDAAKMEELLG